MNNSKMKLIGAMIIFGSVGLFVRNIPLPSSVIALVRAVLGCLFLLSATFISKKNLSINNIKSNIIPLMISGIAMGFNWIFLFQAYKYTTISKATLCYYLAPVLVTFLSIFIFKEKLKVSKSLSIIIAMIGMVLVVGLGNGVFEKNQLLGISFGLIAALLYTSVIISNKFIKNLSGIESAISQLLIAAVVVLPYVVFTEKVQLNELRLNSVIILLIVGIVHTGIAYLLYFSAIPRLSGQTIGILSYIDPIFAIIMSGIIFSEKMTMIQICGGILILGATFVNEILSKEK